MRIHSFLLYLIFYFLLQQVNGQYISGYLEDVSGEILRYDSHQPDADSSLLIRSESISKHIEWLTAKTPTNLDQDYVEFIMIAGIDVNADENHQFDLFVNETYCLSFRNPMDTLVKSWDIEGQNGIRFRFRGIMTDKYGDLFGYIFLKVPKSQFVPGRSVRIKVTGESAGSRSWFMVFRYRAVQKIKFVEEQAIVLQNNKEHQVIRVDILHFDKPGDIAIKIGETANKFSLSTGFNLFRINVPRVNDTVKVQASVLINDRQIFDDSIPLTPVKEYTVYLLPHSHTDIGYTHIQSKVEKIQWQNLREAIKYSNKTKDYPTGSQFKWNVEVMWALDSYYKNANNREKDEFITSVQNGWIELNGLYANILTGLCRQEELYRMIQSAYTFGDICDVGITSAMLSDIPGNTWSLIPVLAQCGIKYFSIGTNTFHRIGSIIEELGDSPFYWESPSKKEKVLCWIHGKGYSEFHTGLGYAKLQNKLKEQLIFDYLNELKNKNYPYDIVTMRYNIGSDNGPPDPYLPDIVKAWNEAYSAPKIVISTVKESFGIMEDKYGMILPVLSGDLTGYWEDGAASSAKETSENRANAERLNQAEILWSIVDPNKFPTEMFTKAWENVLLYHEHTWGSWNSISEPHSEFTLQQWNTKKNFVTEAESQSKELLNNVYHAENDETKTSIGIYNTNSWERSDLVKIPANHQLIGDRVLDEYGNYLPSQRLSTGELVFLARDIPATGVKRYTIEEGVDTFLSINEISEYAFKNDLVSVKIDKNSGNISNLKFKSIPWNINDTAQRGLNEYLYVSGRDPSNTHSNNVIDIRIKEIGPVITSFLIISEAPGCNRITTELTIIEGIERLDIVNTIDKKDAYKAEGVHYAFPFNIPDGEIKISNAIGHYSPDKQQIRGSNKNFFTANRWVDISNTDYGITWVTLDAPLIELGEPTMDALEYGWIHATPKTQKLVSYVMNNYWETNYKASQNGNISFRYSIYPHDKFDAVQSEKWGVEQHQPLIALPDDKAQNSFNLPFTLGNQNTLLTSVKKPLEKDGIMLRLYNPHHESELLSITLTESTKKIYISDPFGKIIKPLKNDSKIPGFSTLTLVIK